ncbi:MAG: GNAT family N-acetyltransferase [Clostridia bacterium]|nr:GNAT family N-acetyltransferase [Clostridia bacterium]
MSEIIFKRMETPEEMQGKARVHYQAWQETYRGQIVDSYLDKMSYEQCLAIAHRWPDNIIVAKDGERVIGFTGYGPYRDESLPQTGEVFAIYVLAEYQKRGVGYRLMEAAMEMLKEYPTVVLWVLKGNQKAIPFYLRYGFRFDGCEKKILIGTHVIEQRMVYQGRTES